MFADFGSHGIQTAGHLYLAAPGDGRAPPAVWRIGGVRMHAWVFSLAVRSRPPRHAPWRRLCKFSPVSVHYFTICHRDALAAPLSTGLLRDRIRNQSLDGSNPQCRFGIGARAMARVAREIAIARLRRGIGSAAK